MSRLGWIALTIIGIVFIGLIAFYTRTGSPPAFIPSFNISPQLPFPTPSIQAQLAVQTFVQNLEVPWDMVFLPDSNMAVITERSGQLRLVDPKGHTDTQPFFTLQNVKAVGEGGLLGITLDPQFLDNRYVYLYYTYSQNGNDTLNRVVRYILGEGGLFHEKVLVDHIPGNLFHNGGRLRFGPDGYLYVTTGDAQKPSQAQDIHSLAGKILRMNREGNPAEENPFNNLVYSYGHRNPQGLAWDSAGQLWETEHGNNATDELNRIEKGKNYGWPTITGDQTHEGMVSPIIHSGKDTWAPSGMAFFEGKLYFAGLRGQSLYEVTNLQSNRPELKRLLQNQFGRLRTVVVGLDNMFYMLTNNRDGRGTPQQGDDKILQIDPHRL